MAAVIGIVACVEGSRSRASAESLGQHTTSSVVQGIFFVILMDAYSPSFSRRSECGRWRAEMTDAIIPGPRYLCAFGATKFWTGSIFDVKRGEILGFVGPSGAGNRC